MKVVIFAGGFGTRIAEESHLRPKPMIEIGGKPILWHIMKIYSFYGFNDFIICLGYKGELIKDYFYNYHRNQSDLQIDIATNEVKIFGNCEEKFNVTLIDTGLNTMTAGRLQKVKQYIGDEDFMLTYGDGVSNVDILALVDFHKSHGKIGTCTAIQPDGRFGALDISDDSMIKSFKEKPRGDKGWINGGFFVFSPGIFDYLGDDADLIMFEEDPLINLTNSNNLAAYEHGGFWKAMDSMRDKGDLEKLWAESAPWKVW